MEHIQYIVKKKTETILFSEKKLRNKNGKYQWSPYFGRDHALVSYRYISLTQLRTGSDQLHRPNRLKKNIKNDFLGKRTSFTKVLQNLK